MVNKQDSPDQPYEEASRGYEPDYKLTLNDMDDLRENVRGAIPLSETNMEIIKLVASYKPQLESLRINIHLNESFQGSKDVQNENIVEPDIKGLIKFNRDTKTFHDKIYMDLIEVCGNFKLKNKIDEDKFESLVEKEPIRFDDNVSAKHHFFDVEKKTQQSLDSNDNILLLLEFAYLVKRIKNVLRDRNEFFEMGDETREETIAWDELDKNNKRLSDLISEYEEILDFLFEETDFEYSSTVPLVGGEPGEIRSKTKIKLEELSQTE